MESSRGHETRGSEKKDFISHKQGQHKIQSVWFSSLAPKTQRAPFSMTGEEHLTQGTSHFVAERDAISPLEDSHWKPGPGQWPGSCLLGKVVGSVGEGAN